MRVRNFVYDRCTKTVAFFQNKFKTIFDYIYVALLSIKKLLTSGRLETAVAGRKTVKQM